ncbi:MAG: sulfatase-like hydrolase/transferase, partial [Sulfobacillus sp.]
MNFIVFVLGTFRLDNLNLYSPRKAIPITPNLNRLLEESASFENYYISSYPSIPLLHDLFTGTFGFLSRGWVPLGSEEQTVIGSLEKMGYVTKGIFDNPALEGDGFNYMRDFSGWDWIRGQHRDRWRTHSEKVPHHFAPLKNKDTDTLKPYFRNVAMR